MDFDISAISCLILLTRSDCGAFVIIVTSDMCLLTGQRYVAAFMNIEHCLASACCLSKVNDI